MTTRPMHDAHAAFGRDPVVEPHAPHFRFAGLPSGLRVLGAIATMIDESLVDPASSPLAGRSSPAHVAFATPTRAEIAAALETVANCAPAAGTLPPIVAARPHAILPSSLFDEPRPSPVVQDSPLEVANITEPAGEIEALLETNDESSEPLVDTTPLPEIVIDKPVDEFAVLKLPKPVRPAVDRAAFPALTEKLAAALRYGRTRVVHWHLVGDDGAGRAHLEALAETWGESRPESLLLIDAQVDPTTFSSRPGWWDVIADRAKLSDALQTTDFPALTRMSVGGRPGLFNDESRLRLTGGLLALQRDHRAIWVVTSGAWSEAAQELSQAAHERYLIVPTRNAQAWCRLSAELVSRNVLVDGWIALSSHATPEPRPIAA